VKREEGEGKEGGGEGGREGRRSRGLKGRGRRRLNVGKRRVAE
jgi:hypothetical protein